MDTRATLTRRRGSVFRHLGWLVVAAMTATALFAAPGVVLGHTPKATLDCTHGLKVDLTYYEPGGTNTVDISIDGVEVDGSPFTFATTFHRTFAIGDLTVPHYADVVVSAWDDPHGSEGWSASIHLTLDACEEPTPVPTYCIYVEKAGADGPLAGAGFTLYDSDKQPVGDEKTTDQDGKVSFCKLSAGTYTLKETTVPAGYLKVDDQEVTVNAESGDVTVKLADELVPTYCINVEKTGAHGDALVGAGFTLYDGNEPVGDEKTTGRDGKVSFCKLSAGTYTLKETTVPAGYLKVDDQEVTVNAESGDVTVKLADEPLPPTAATIIVEKVIDPDGDLATTDDQFPGEGWTFSAAVTNGDVDKSPNTTDADGLVSFVVTHGGDGATTVDVAEEVQEDYAFLDASCTLLEAPVGTVGDGKVTGIEVKPGDLVLCTFFNTGGGVSPATATPKVTPPPTDALPGSPAGPAGDTWRLALLGIAAVLAVTLLLTPAMPAKVRRRR